MKFPDDSIFLSRYREKIRESLQETLAVLPDEIYLAYTRHVSRTGENPESLRSYIRWNLFHYFFQSGFLQAALIHRNRLRFTFGAEILPWSSLVGSPYMDRHHIKGMPLSLLRAEETAAGDSLLILGVVPDDLHSPIQKITRREILPLVAGYYSHLPSLEKRKRLDLVRNLEREIRECVREPLESGQPVTFTHFRFKDLTVFFEISGEHKSQEILEEVTRLIVENMKKTDHLFEIAPGSYLVISPDSRKDPIQKRLFRTFFQIHSLVLDYQIHQTTLHKPPLRLNELWKSLQL